MSAVNAHDGGEEDEEDVLLMGTPGIVDDFRGNGWASTGKRVDPTGKDRPPTQEWWVAYLVAGLATLMSAVVMGWIVFRTYKPSLDGYCNPLQMCDFGVGVVYNVPEKSMYVKNDPLCDSIMRVPVPDIFKVRFTTSKGKFTVNVVKAWNPAAARWFYKLGLARYWEDSWFYKVVKGGRDERPNPRVVQFGYSGTVADNCVTSCFARSCIHSRSPQKQISISPGIDMFNDIYPSINPGNVRGTVAFGAGYGFGFINGAINVNMHQSMLIADGTKCDPTNVVINLSDNQAHLSPLSFHYRDGGGTKGGTQVKEMVRTGIAPFGYITEEDMSTVVDELYSGYGETTEFCGQEELCMFGCNSTDLSKCGEEIGCQSCGVNSTNVNRYEIMASISIQANATHFREPPRPRMVEYLADNFPLMDRIQGMRMEVVEGGSFDGLEPRGSEY